VAGRGNLVDYQHVLRLLRPPKNSGGLAMTMLGFFKGLNVRGNNAGLSVERQRQ
jgi:hypothetical protein